MHRTHLSLYYLIAYLFGAGLTLITVPGLALKLLFSNGNYGDVLPRLLGVVVLALGILVLQIVRHHVEVLYGTTLIVRAVLLTVVISLYFYSRDPFFISLTVIIGFGVLLTGVSFWLDRQHHSLNAPSHP